ncbi:MAG: DUF4162 domain-containing protein [Spirochaetales bacterium]|nr:DUF4162 domain-containing protein [Spirochaetales bacterium]
MDHAEKICSDIFLINRGKTILSGPLDKIKNDRSKKSIVIEFDGDRDFIKSLSMIETVIEYPRFMEIELKAGYSPDELLKELVGKIRIQKFEIASPSLHKIFIDAVGADQERQI